MSETKTLLDYVPDLLDDLEKRQAEVDAERAEARRIALKIDETRAAITKRRGEILRPDRSRSLAEAALAGAPVPPEPPEPPGPTIPFLEDTVRGLQDLKAAAEKRASDRHGELRAALGRLYPAAAERVAVDYVKHAQILAALHAAIGAADEGSHSVPGREPWDGVLTGPEWLKLYVPFSDQLEAFRPHFVRHRNPQAVAGGSVEECGKAAHKALEAAHAEIRRRLGGRWPFDRE